MKKAQADPMKLIVVAVILLIAMVIIIVIFRGLIGKEAKQTEGTIDRIGSDSDNDGVNDIIDFCPYNSNYARKGDTPHESKDDCGTCISEATKC